MKPMILGAALLLTACDGGDESAAPEADTAASPEKLVLTAPLVEKYLACGKELMTKFPTLAGQNAPSTAAGAVAFNAKIEAFAKDHGFDSFEQLITVHGRVMQGWGAIKAEEGLAESRKELESHLKDPNMPPEHKAAAQEALKGMTSDTLTAQIPAADLKLVRSVAPRLDALMKEVEADPK